MCLSYSSWCFDIAGNINFLSEKKDLQIGRTHQATGKFIKSRGGKMLTESAIFLFIMGMYSVVKFVIILDGLFNVAIVALYYSLLKRAELITML